MIWNGSHSPRAASSFASGCAGRHRRREHLHHRPDDACDDRRIRRCGRRRIRRQPSGGERNCGKSKAHRLLTTSCHNLAGEVLCKMRSTDQIYWDEIWRFTGERTTRRRASPRHDRSLPRARLRRRTCRRAAASSRSAPAARRGPATSRARSTPTPGASTCRARACSAPRAPPPTCARASRSSRATSSTARSCRATPSTSSTRAASSSTSRRRAACSRASPSWSRPTASW